MDLERTTGTEGIDAFAPGASDPLPGDRLARIVPRVVGAYAVAGAAWIVFSDLAVGIASEEPFSDQLPDIAKGLLFVVTTATVLWAVLHRLTDRYDRIFARRVTAQRDFFGRVLATSSDVVAIFGADGRTVWVNDAIEELLGWRSDEVVGAPGRTFIHPADRTAAVGFREGLGAVTGMARPERTFLLRHRDGSFRAMEVRGAAITLADGEEGVVINARDVTDRARSERQLRAAMAEDVTGLPHLRMFVAEMEGLDELRPDGLVATVALIDVERFRDINDLYGRGGGDVVLRELAGRLEAAVPEALGVWRHGADEFVLVVLEGAVGVAGPEPQGLADRIQAATGAPVLLDESGTRVTVELSVGVAHVDLGRHAEGEALSTLLLRAGERALQDAKQHPDRTAVHLGGAVGRHGDRARVVAELHDALERGELVVHYQPKVRLADMRMVGVEALVRWLHPVRGLLGPAEFLGAVAEANLSAAVVRVVLDDALSRATRWGSATGDDAPVGVCVNVSADDLRRKRFAADVLGALDAHGVDPRRLCLELTEQTMLADPDTARAVLDELRRTGIEVAIDDFGTGYSTLEHIRVFEVDELKIDKGFVQRLGTSPADEAIVDSVLAITERIGVRVTGEGIEHQLALDYLRDRGCALGQGYLLSRPVPGDGIDPTQTF